VIAQTVDWLPADALTSTHTAMVGKQSDDGAIEIYEYETHGPDPGLSDCAGETPIPAVHTDRTNARLHMQTNDRLFPHRKHRRQ
jgi:hypothetical protein